MKGKEGAEESWDGRRGKRAKTKQLGATTGDALERVGTKGKLSREGGAKCETEGANGRKSEGNRRRDDMD